MDACDLFGVSSSAYYAWEKKLGQPDPDKDRMQLVLEAYERSRKTYGYRRIQIWIEREYGIKINHKAVLRLMRKLNIRSVARKRNPYRLIQNQYGSIHTYPNLLRQNFTAKQPNEKWGTDITYIPTQQGFVYLAVIKDFFDGTILGHSFSRNNSIQMVLQAVRAATSGLQPRNGVIIQSDQGVQFQSVAYHSLISELGITPSMSRKGNCLDNAPTESFFSQLKEELIRHIKIKDYQDAIRIVDDYIHFYNHDRIQLKTKLTPMEFRRQFV
jgi:transposase InsO family protein